MSMGPWSVSLTRRAHPVPASSSADTVHMMAMSVSTAGDRQCTRLPGFPSLILQAISASPSGDYRCRSQRHLVSLEGANPVPSLSIAQHGSSILAGAHKEVAIWGERTADQALYVSPAQWLPVRLAKQRQSNRACAGHVCA